MLTRALVAGVIFGMAAFGAFAQSEGEPAPEGAQDAGQPEGEGQPQVPVDLPVAQNVFERHVQAIGGRDALKRSRSRHIKGLFESPIFAYPVRLNIWQEVPNKIHLKISEPAGKTIEICYDGELGWENQPGIGHRLLEGPRLTELIETSDFYGEASYEDLYTEMETIGLSDFEGEPAIIVKVKTPSGRMKQLLFGAEDGLFKALRSMVAHPVTHQPTEFQVTLRDYKDFDGVLFPTRMEQQFIGAPAGNVFRYREVIVNSAEPHDFHPPFEIRKTEVETDDDG